MNIVVDIDSKIIAASGAVFQYRDNYLVEIAGDMEKCVYQLNESNSNVVEINDEDIPEGVIGKIFRGIGADGKPVFENDKRYPANEIIELSELSEAVAELSQYVLGGK